MNNQWVKILVFGLLFGIGGYLIGRTCGHGCGHRGGCHGEAGCHKDGHHKGHMHGQDGKDACCAEGHMGMGHGEGHEERIHTIIHGLKESGFQGDTTIKDGDATVNISLHGEKMEVRVEMGGDSAKVIEKSIEVH
jgi:hypothetical protein